MPRFVILRHEFPAGHERSSHWDFMLEAGDYLRTWALPEEPRQGVSLVAEPLAGHRLAYLDYEGPVSGGRGKVTACDRGTYELISEDESEVVVRLTGGRLGGLARLVRQAGNDQGWMFALGDAE